MMDPMSGQNIPIRQVLKIIDNNTHIMEQYNTKNGKEFKTMEIKFTRK
jgi:alcohol dehydrogenase YqhD (iron-dependent ADH family)